MIQGHVRTLVELAKRQRWMHSNVCTACPFPFFSETNYLALQIKTFRDGPIHRIHSPLIRNIIHLLNQIYDEKLDAKQRRRIWDLPPSTCAQTLLRNVVLLLSEFPWMKKEHNYILNQKKGSCIDWHWHPMLHMDLSYIHGRLQLLLCFFWGKCL